MSELQVRTTRLLGLGILSGLFIVGIGMPFQAHAAIPLPAGKVVQSQTCQPGGDLPPQAQGVTESVARTSDGQCEVIFTAASGGGRLLVEYNTANTTETITQYDANNNQVGTPKTLSWADASAQGAAQVAANPSVNPTISAATASSSAATAATDQQTQQQQNQADQNSCGVTHIGLCFLGIIYSAIKMIATFFLLLASFFLGLVGLLFNWTIYITVFQFGNLIGNNPGMLAAWGVLRDIGNILLLFGFIFMGVSTILNLPGSEFTARRALPTLIIFAILMNFSLFAAEAVIDTSNALGSTFYRQAGNGLCPDSTVSQIDCATKYGIAGSVMEISGITKIFDSSDLAGFPTNDMGAAIGLMGLTLFVAVLAFVLLAAVFMLIARAVTLAFLMAVSPIGFAGMAVPPLHRFATMWWDQLLKQAFFAPVYILLVLISVKFMDGIRTTVAGGAQVTLISLFSSGGISNLSIAVLFVLLIGFLLAATQSARSMAAVGANGATKMAGAAVFGTMARASNFTFGSAARLARVGVRNIPVVGKSPVGGFITNQMLRPIENANFDLRRAPGMGAVQKIAGGPAEHASYSDMRHQVSDVKKGMQKSDAEYKMEIAKFQLIKDAKEAKKNGENLDPKSEQVLMRLTGEEIAADHDLSHAMGDLADRLSPDQFAAYMKSDKASDAEKGHARDARYGKLAEQVSTSNGGQVRKWSNSDLEQFVGSKLYAEMSDEDKEEFISLLSDDQFDALNKSSRVTNSQKTSFQSLRTNGRFNTTKDAFEVDPADATKRRVMMAADGTTPLKRIDRTLKGMSSDKRAKLDDDVLANPDVYTRLNPADFDAIRRSDKLSDAQRSTLGAHISSVVRDISNPNSARFVTYLKSIGDTKRGDMEAFYNTNFGITKS